MKQCTHYTNTNCILLQAAPSTRPGVVNAKPKPFPSEIFTYDTFRIAPHWQQSRPPPEEWELNW